LQFNVTYAKALRFEHKRREGQRTGGGQNTHESVTAQVPLGLQDVPQMHNLRQMAIWKVLEKLGRP
jgi:hypothetical protein